MKSPCAAGSEENKGDRGRLCHVATCTTNTKTEDLDVLTTGDNCCGTSSTDLVPLEGSQRTPAVDAVEDAEKPHVNGTEKTKEVRHTHQKEADGKVDNTLNETVVEESELGGDKRYVKLTKNHDNTGHHCENSKKEESPAHVLIAQVTVRVEEIILIHVDENVELARRIILTILFVDGPAEPMLGQSEVIHVEVLLAISSKSRLQAIGENIIVIISLKNCNIILGGPLKKKIILRTDPDLMAAEALAVSESNPTDIPSVPLEEWYSKETASISSDSHDTKNGKDDTTENASDEENLAEDDLASAPDFFSFHD